jgi:hypothetical protein
VVPGGSTARGCRRGLVPFGHAGRAHASHARAARSRPLAGRAADVDEPAPPWGQPVIPSDCPGGGRAGRAKCRRHRPGSPAGAVPMAFPRWVLPRVGLPLAGVSVRVSAGEAAVGVAGRPGAAKRLPAPPPVPRSGITTVIPQATTTPWFVRSTPGADRGPVSSSSCTQSGSIGPCESSGRFVAGPERAADRQCTTAARRPPHRAPAVTRTRTAAAGRGLAARARLVVSCGSSRGSGWRPMSSPLLFGTGAAPPAGHHPPHRSARSRPGTPPLQSGPGSPRVRCRGKPSSRRAVQAPPVRGPLTTLGRAACIRAITPTSQHAR